MVSAWSTASDVSAPSSGAENLEDFWRVLVFTLHGKAKETEPDINRGWKEQ